MEVDCVVAEALRCFVALPTTTLKGFAHPYLSSVAVLGMILNSVYILISLFTSWNWACKRLFISSVHVHGTEDGLGADGAFCGP